MTFSPGWLALSAALSAPQQVSPPAVPPAVQQTDPQPDETIVSDPDFEKALPPLSDDINAPLEAMPAATPPARTLPDLPAQAPVADTNTLAPLSAEEPELTRALPPLGTFDSTPPVNIADTGDDKTVVIRYDTQVNGLDALGLTGQFNGLSALKDGGGKAANAAMVSARAREDEALAVRLLKSRGYYDGTAISTIESVPNSGNVKAIISATPGKLYSLGSIAIEAGPVVPADLLTRELPLRVGDPIEADRIQGAEANVSLKLPQQGYPFVTLGQRDILLDEATWTGAYTLPVDTGPRSSFGTYTTEGKLAFEAEHVGVLARFKPGELYDNRKVDDLRDALVATGLFSTVSVEPVRTGKPGPDGTEAVDLLVRQEAGPPRSVAASAGYSTGQGFRLEGSFTHRDLWKPEGALILSAIAGTQEQGLGATFRRSNAGKRDRTVTLTASANHSNYDAFNAFTGTLAGRISYDSTPIWQKKLTYAYGFELIGTNESVYDFARLEKRRATYGILALPGQLQFDTSDNLLNPTKGYRLKLSLSPETSVRGGVRPYARILIEGSIYQPVTDSIVLAGRLRAGTIPGIDRDDLAPSRRYYGGGGGSVRGYGYQRLGPFDPNGDPVGGRSLNEFSLEARYRFGNYGIVPFIDGGNAYEGVMPKGSDLRYGAGIGGRFYTNFGPLRVDVATPLNPRPGDGKVALYISIGQAF
ncbi:BamA/TamA family outer membrane protein [Sphingomonas sp. So64.6b]|uniref:autotransporter assembly complex protein TamA n=1 Tax=Sphingomonas sp. So64.6b TaxID=2997354 RepID=UPI0015FF6C7D|nr:BamA/TamA family outer membrane protein [Sphingomonas sp. So64.6b]QNA86801.1 BamA/TamA family outer membrane protein [Sphingomonas sp. So64.6b]